MSRASTGPVERREGDGVQCYFGRAESTGLTGYWG